MKQRMLTDIALKQNGPIIELTKRIFDEKGYAYLQKKKQEIYEINMQI